MSDTPRTDNLIVETHSLGTWGELVNADFARKLERENAALRAMLQRADDTLAVQLAKAAHEDALRLHQLYPHLWPKP